MKALQALALAHLSSLIPSHLLSSSLYKHRKEHWEDDKYYFLYLFYRWDHQVLVCLSNTLKEMVWTPEAGGPEPTLLFTTSHLCPSSDTSWEGRAWVESRLFSVPIEEAEYLILAFR